LSQRVAPLVSEKNIKAQIDKIKDITNTKIEKKISCLRDRFVSINIDIIQIKQKKRCFFKSKFEEMSI